VGQRGHKKSRDYNFFLLKMKRESSIGNKIIIHHKILSAVKRTEFVIDRVSYTVLRCRWCNIIILEVRTLSEEKSDDSKDILLGIMAGFFLIFLTTM
jgi:hypothetical protein